MLPLKDSIIVKILPAATWILVLLNVLVFVYESSLPPDTIESFFRNACVVPESFFGLSHANQLNKLVISMFTHAGFLHIFLNMWTLRLFGDAIEVELGWAKYVALYISCGLISTLVQVATMHSSNIPIVGASGAIAGVLGAYWVLFPTAYVDTLVLVGFIVRVIKLPACIFLGLWFVLQLASGVVSLFVVTGRSDVIVGFWAHASGFVLGIALTKLSLLNTNVNSIHKPD